MLYQSFVFFKICSNNKKYLNGRSSDENIYNNLISIITDKYDINNKINEKFYYNKEDCSRIKNLKLDISNEIRLYLSNKNIINDILPNTCKFIDDYININFIEQIILEISNLYTNDLTISKETTLYMDQYKNDFNKFIAITLVEVLKYPNIKRSFKMEI